MILGELSIQNMSHEMTEWGNNTKKCFGKTVTYRSFSKARDKKKR